MTFNNTLFFAKKNFGLSLMLIIALFMYACSDETDPNPEPEIEDVAANTKPFIKGAGGTEDEDARASITDAIGNLYVTGNFKGTITFEDKTLTSKGYEDAFLAKYDTNGKLIWLRHFSGPSYSSGRCLAIDNSGNIVVGGEFSGALTIGETELTAYGQYNTFIAKYKKNGDFISAMKDGTSGPGSAYGLSWIRSILFDAAGNMYIAGTFYYETVFGDISLIGSEDYEDQMFVVKYNTSNQVVWANKCDGTAIGEDAAISKDGTKVYVTGRMYGTVTFGEGEAATELTSAGEGDIFMVGYSTSSGDLFTAERAGDTGNDGGYGMAVDSQGFIYVTGYFQKDITYGSTTVTAVGFNDMFLIKWGSGEIQWVRHSHGYAAGTTVAIDADDKVFVSGWFTAESNFGSGAVTPTGAMDIFAAKYDGTGSCVWVDHAGGTQSDWSQSMCIDKLGNVFATGIFSGSTKYGNTTLTAAGGRDIMMVKMSSK